jgi:hypothetical protein
VSPRSGIRVEHFECGAEYRGNLGRASGVIAWWRSNNLAEILHAKILDGALALSDQNAKSLLSARMGGKERTISQEGLLFRSVTVLATSVVRWLC